MKYEVEQKFPVASLDSLEQQLRAMGVEFSSPVEQIDQYYAHPSRDFAATDEALRIRHIGSSGRITYKGPKIDTTTKTRREIELPVGSGAQVGEFHELLVALGFSPVAEVKKQRRTGNVDWQDQVFEVALDEVNGVGSFAELEIQAEQHELDAARGALLSLAEHLDLHETERRSYLEMLLELE